MRRRDVRRTDAVSEPVGAWLAGDSPGAVRFPSRRLPLLSVVDGDDAQLPAVEDLWPAHPLRRPSSPPHVPGGIGAYSSDIAGWRAEVHDDRCRGCSARLLT